MVPRTMFLMVALLASAALGQYKRVLLSSVETVTLEAGKMTTGRRTSPIQQLRCTGNCHLAAVERVHCKNLGSDGLDAQWQCTAVNLPAGVSLGRIEMVCEVFEYPEDPYVTAGSCGLEYALSSTTPYRAHYVSPQASGGAGWLSLLVMAGVAYVVWRTCSARARNNPPEPEPPARPPRQQPYRRDEDRERDEEWARRSGYERSYPEPYMPMDPGMGMGGFWGGLGMGALGGYMMGRRNYGYGGYGGYRPPRNFQPTIPTGGWEYGSGIGGYTPGPGWAGGGDAPPPPRDKSAQGGTRRR